MKKYTLFLFVLAFVFGSINIINVDSAKAANCAPGENFNTSTGQPCSGVVPVTPGCAPGDLYNSVTGHPCGGIISHGQYDAFATYLKNQGAVLYGAFWCPHCQTQKTLFGSSARLLPYVECSTPDASGQLQVCIDKKITSYPTWEFADGSRLLGEQTLQQLADKTSYVWPPASPSSIVLGPSYGSVGTRVIIKAAVAAGVADNYITFWSVSSNGGTSRQFHVDLADSVPLSFVVPATLIKHSETGDREVPVTPGTYAVAVSNVNGKSPVAYFKVTSTSNQFITVLSPNGGETFTQGANNIIQWSGLPLSQVDIILTKLNGTQVGYIYSHTFADGATNMMYWTGQFLSVDGTFTSNSYITVIPGQYKVLIKSTDGQSQDLSDAPFNLISGTTTSSITVLSPNGGESYSTGNTIPIRWTASNLPTGTYVILQLSYRENNGATFEDGIANEDGTQPNLSPSVGLYQWKIPSQYGSKQHNFFKIRAVLVGPNIPSTNSLDDYSNNYFTINGGTIVNPSITVFSPNGGESIAQGVNRPISWSSSGNFPSNSFVTIFLDQGNQNVGYFASNQPLSGSYQADFSRVLCGSGVSPVSVTPGSNFKIRVGVSTGNTVACGPVMGDFEKSITLAYDTSDTPFTVSGTPTTNSSITVTSPNGGEIWTKGTTQTISWQDNNNISTHEIKLVHYVYVPPCIRAPGQVFIACPSVYVPPPITIANTQGSSYNWLVGQTLDINTVSDGQYTIQVCQTGTDTCGSSNSYFNVTSMPTTTPIAACSVSDIYAVESTETINAYNLYMKVNNLPGSSDAGMVGNVAIDGADSWNNLLFNLDGAYNPSGQTILKANQTINSVGTNYILARMNAIHPIMNGATAIKCLSLTLPSGGVLGAASFQFTQRLQLGSAGNEVMELQLFLTRAGYDIGIADGGFGAKTQAAVIQFETANKLDGDGIVGAQVRALLNK